MKSLLHKSICLVVLASAFLMESKAQKKFELEDIGKLVNLSDPQISPDGKSIVLVVSRPDYSQNRFSAELVLVDISSGKQRLLTQDRPNVSQPRWSPSGEYLSFIAKAQSKDGVNQLYVLPMSGGDAKQITKTPKGVQHYAWSPNSESLAYVTSDEPLNKTELEKGGSDAFEVGNNDMFLSAAPLPSHIWLVGVNGGECKRLTSGTWSLPVTIPPGPPSSPLSWSGDGKTIAFAKVQTPFSGDAPWRSINLLTIADGSLKALSGRSKYEGYPSFSPDGSRVAYWFTQDAMQGNINDIWLAPVTGGEGQNLSGTLDRDIYRSVWMPDGKNILIGGHDDQRTSLWIQPIDGSAKKLNLGTISPSWGFWVDVNVGKNGGIAFTGSDPGQPTELFYMASVTALPRQITNFNNEVKSMTLGKTETMRWEIEGYKHSGTVTYPTGYAKGKKYPLVLIVHGGPNAASVEIFSSRAQLFANKGYFVFEPNYRGSDNSGSKYKTAIIKDMGAGPGRDVMAGLKQLKNSGMIDTTNIALTGWSYGGFMTVWLAGHYPGWKATVAGASVTDWVDQYNLSDANVIRGNVMGGSPWTGAMQSYIDQSPITNANKITAPTLILGNTEDPRVPITQSYKLFHALKDNGVTTKFIAWPIPLHNANDPVRQREVTKFWMEWVDQYLQDGKNMNVVLDNEKK